MTSILKTPQRSLSSRFDGVRLGYGACAAILPRGLLGEIENKRQQMDPRDIVLFFN